MIDTYGVKCYAQTKEFHKKSRKRYMYDGMYFDSSWELAFWIYNVDHSIPISKCSVRFEYTVNDKVYYYFPDFKVGDDLIEIKGDHLREGRLPYKGDSLQQTKFLIKYNCAIENGVKFLYKDDLKQPIDYCKDKYNNKNWYRQFLCKREEK